MSAILPQLERDLLVAAHCSLAPEAQVAGEERPGPVRRLASRGGRIRRLPFLLLGLFGVLGTTTIALAATGVILTGAPVRPEGRLTPRAGIGVPKPGGSVLLPLRAPDPAGGPPWGMRIVHTTRGEVCLQIGRIHDGRLGELGIDGAFHDDGRFHPEPATALPGRPAMGGFGTDSEAGDSSCVLADQALSGDREGTERNASSYAAAIASRPRADLRNIYFGLLGPHARSVSYRVGSTIREEAVQPGIGAYLIVERVTAHQGVGRGGGAEGTIDDLSPGQKRLTAFTYRLGGRLCERAGPHARGVKPVLAHPCSQPRFNPSPRGTRDLHRPIGVRFVVRQHRVAAAVVSFEAPRAVTSAGAEYVVEIPGYDRDGSINGFDDTPTEHDVRKGNAVSVEVLDPFANRCFGHPVVVRVSYQNAVGTARTIVGRKRIQPPPGVTAPIRRCPSPRPFTTSSVGRRPRH